MKAKALIALAPLVLIIAAGCQKSAPDLRGIPTPKPPPGYGAAPSPGSGPAPKPATPPTRK